MSDVQKLRQELEQLLREVKRLVHSSEWHITNENHSKMWNEMVSKAVQLHKIVQPKHHKNMIEKRRYSPDYPGFYNHIHPIEELLKYMDDPTSNDDPVDKTICDKSE
ncbi:hypothetical protein [Desulfosporosinus sp. BICA1-9]|uniref:hypothetical protein n=1 Tax=Desulfosporosinus sp. BICA1-9 TaxID=1531958 RepID=UPI00054C22B7|nr:hypothetical protein [Desulfosporosinus sp. BICA1-9]KJS49281.1 MAG: hypothetical protein VR66_09230 [Peptococcaceae bacterium BRH_c23]KJS81189.1 MAG: hypothetical protein JL57_26885 [Desulfosporosinus sp. BICA1-9]HBW37540.1 hypothetical protein [Desulfosporosinus sp.]